MIVNKAICIATLIKLGCVIYFPIFLISSLFSQKGVSPLENNNNHLQSYSTYAVIVGISDYQSPQIPDLQFAHSDALAFVKWLKSAAGGFVPNENIKLLLNNKASLAQFGAALDWLLEICKPGDQAIVYFSGHGDVETRTRFQPGFLLCWDAPPKVYTAGGAYGLFYLQDLISTLSIDRSVRVMVISDACHAGKLAGSNIGGPQATALSMKQQYANEIKILSCQPDEVSIEGAAWGGGRGVFSYHLIDGLTGLADENNDHVISLSEIDHYLEKKVVEETDPHRQTPMTVGNRQLVIAHVNDSTLFALKDFKQSNPSLFEMIGTKGNDYNISHLEDSIVSIIFKNFNKALDEKNLLNEDSLSANSCYLQLLKTDNSHPALKIMKRSLAAALQDEVQQFLNKLLQDDPYEINQWRLSSNKFQNYIDYLTRSVELLGSNHYSYNSLMANKLFFESYNLAHYSTSTYTYYPDSIRKLSRLKLNEALQYKDDAMINYLLGNSYQYTLYEDSVRFFYMKAIDLAPQWLQPYAEISWYYLDQMYDYEEAEKWLMKGLQIDANAYGLLEMKAWLYQRYDKLDSVEAICKRMRSIHPRLPNDYNTLAYTYTYLGRDYKLAEKNFHLTESIKKTIKNHEKWVLGDIERNTRRFDSAKVHCRVEDFSEFYFGDLLVFTHKLTNFDIILNKSKAAFANESDPAFKYNALVVQGIVNYYLENYTVSKELLMNALERYYVPTASKSLALAYLGLLGEKANDYKSAENYFNQAIHFRPNEYVYQSKPIKSAEYFFYGDFLLQQNRFMEAEEKFRIILSKDYGCIFGFYGMAKLCAKKKLRKETLDWLELALDWYFPISNPINEEPLFNFIRKTKRFKEMMNKHFGQEY